MKNFHGNQWGSSDPAERFWAKVKRSGPDECWEWQGQRQKSGHGGFGIGGRMVRAHRFSYELAHGPIGDGLLVCHSCDNPPCVNPAHLFVGSQTDNMQDAARKGRVGRKPGFAGQAGERHPQARLTVDDVREIRRRKARGETFTALARAYGVSRGCILGVVDRINWRHVD